MIKPTENVISIERPTQCRDIPPKYRSYRGSIRTTKSNMIQNSFDFESGLERDLLLLLDHDVFCSDFQTQPSLGEDNSPFTWIDDTGKRHTSYPDIWAKFSTNKQILWQVKPFNELVRLKEDNDWIQEINALERYCKARNWEFRIITELEIRTQRLNTISRLRASALHPPNEQLLQSILKILSEFFKNGRGSTFHELSTKNN